VAALVVVLVVVGGDGEVDATGATPTPAASASALAVVSPSPTAKPTISPTPVATATPVQTATAQPATPEPAPPGPPATLTLGWARIETELNLRAEPALAAGLIARLAGDEVVWVASAPHQRDGFSWYQVQTLNKDTGWIASGPADEPYATIISGEETLLSCGAVESDGGVRVDGLRPGPLDAAQRGAFEMTDATQGEACVTYALENREAVRYIQLFLDACGAPVWDGDRLTLKPTSYGDVINDYKVKRTVEVAPALLTERSAVDDDGLTNKLKVFILGGQLAKPFACTSVYLDEEGSDSRREIEVWLGGECLILTELTATDARVRPASGGSSVSLRRMSTAAFSGITIDKPTIVNLFSTTSASEGERLWMGGFGGC
jgi:hypothetical protein